MVGKIIAAQLGMKLFKLCFMPDYSSVPWQLSLSV